MRISPAVRAVLRSFLANPGGQCFGYALMQSTELPSGSVYPILRRLETAGWLVSAEDQSAEPGRPRRRCYRLTDLGLAEASKAVGAEESSPSS